MQIASFSIITHCVLLIATCTFASAQTIQQKDLFSEALSTAWKNKSESALSRLYFTEGADQFQIDQTIATWTAQRELTPQTTITLKAIYTKAETETLASNEKDHRTGRFSRLLKSWNAPVVMNGHTYVQNLSLVGYAEIVISGNEGGSYTRFEPIGIDPDGNLRLCLLRLKR